MVDYEGSQLLRLRCRLWAVDRKANSVPWVNYTCFRIAIHILIIVTSVLEIKAPHKPWISGTLESPMIRYALPTEMTRMQKMRKPRVLLLNIISKRLRLSRMVNLFPRTDRISGDWCCRILVLFILIPDQVQPKLFNNTILPHLKDDVTIVVASGYNVFFKLLQFKPKQNVVMVAPRFAQTLFETSSWP